MGTAGPVERASKACLFACRGRRGLAVAAFALAVTASGCAGGFSLRDWGAPGQNTRIGKILIRYAHMAEPRGGPWKPGDDVPAYVWLYNKDVEVTDKFVGASTPKASSVDIVDSDGKPLPHGVALPTEKLVELKPGRTHLVLNNVHKLIRGGDFMKITLRFEKAGSITFLIQCQTPGHDESPTPTR